MLGTLPAPSLDWCLFLDVDGTLIELTDSPFDTVADAEIKALLTDVAERLGGAVALVSGRSIDYLDALFTPCACPRRVCTASSGARRRESYTARASWTRSWTGRAPRSKRWCWRTRARC